MNILKLGGPAITKKNRRMTPNMDNIWRLVEEIAEAEPQRLIIVHGGGSFGHPVAKEYRIAEGYSSDIQIIGFSRTHQAMVKLNRIIVDAFLDAAVSAISVSPSSFIITKDRRIKKADFNLIQCFLDDGMMPVLFGDAVLDQSNRFSILSGDQLVVRLALDLEIEKIIFGIDVDGVYTSDPKKDPNARLIDHFSVKNIGEKVKLEKSMAIDVTGGMQKKIEEATPAVEAGIQVQLVNASKSNRVLNALRGKPVPGTILTR